MNFRSLFDLRIEHAYYEDSRCSDFQVEPNEKTRRLIRNHKGILKTNTDGFQLAVPLDVQGQPLIPLQIGTVFSFLLSLKNPEFVVFTELDGFSKPALLHYSNEGLNNSGDVELSRGQIIKPRCVDYFAQIDIHIDGNMTEISDLQPRFVIRFNARQVYWQYYFVTNLKHGKDVQFQIRDVNEGSAGASIIFQQVNVDNAPDKISESLVEQYPSMEYIQFVSEQSVPCSQVIKKNIQLFLGNEKLLANLPNPPCKNFSRLAEQKDDGIEMQDSLFQVIKYISQPFTINGT